MNVASPETHLECFFLLFYTCKGRFSFTRRKCSI